MNNSAKTGKTGNRCGHDPHNPQFTLTKPMPVGKGGYPAILTTAMKRMTKYYNNQKLFPSLNRAKSGYIENYSTRKQRSERREACIVTMAALLKHTELSTLCVAIPTFEGLSCIGFDYITQLTGMNERRVQRAVRDLKEAGFLTVSQPRQTMPDGSIRGMVAVKAISVSFFGALGLEEQLKHARDYASKNIKKKMEAFKDKKATRTAQHRARLFMNGKAQGLSKPTQKRSSAATNDYEINQAKRLIDIQVKLMELYPNRSSDWIRSEAKRQLKKE